MSFEVSPFGGQELPFVEGKGSGYQADAVVQPPFTPEEGLIHEITGQEVGPFGDYDGQRLSLRRVASTDASMHIRVEARAVPDPAGAVDEATRRLGEYLNTLNDNPGGLAELLESYKADPIPPHIEEPTQFREERRWGMNAE